MVTLPRPGDRFFGREPELRALAELGPVTIVGPPGIGKSRLVLEHARRTGVSVLAARRPLRRSDETVLRLGPLDEDDAVALLADRTGLPADALWTVARRLDGIPLALELAAVRIRAL